MSLVGHFMPYRGELRMPSAEGAGSGELGIRFEGAVLSGMKSVEARQAEEAARRVVKVEDEGYGQVRDYDPVLRAHCRL